MNNEGITSLAVVDNHLNVVGNISNADVKVCRSLSTYSAASLTFSSVVPDKVKLSTVT